LRYARELESLDSAKIGGIDFVSGIMAKSWERYGVHAVEGLYRILGPGVQSILNLGQDKLNLVLLEYAFGQQALLQVIYDSKIFGRYDIFGEKGTLTVETKDTFYMFKKQLQVFVDFVRDRKYPYPPEETIEIIKVIVAGIRSRREKRKVDLKEIC
jgi:predicted dehydrogenase